MENKRSVFFIGAVALFVNVGIFSASMYVGLRYGISFHDALVSLRKAMNLDFSLLNSLCIALCCVMANAKNINRYFLPILFLSILMGALNLFFISQNIFLSFNLLFWFGTMYYLLKQRSNEKHRERMEKLSSP